ncbi:hypothetical protein CFC21_038538 [Triticum aestivum]|uniref:Wall-associated receptor kinase galacturonan-binding domain-containing protein n=2 Tax=Triticum aestivum TaxID=4565 RepID=A0A9R1FEG9_WHEAT|nr:hypothetical protein CFC21_038538 [Triticum aestivum]
MSILPVIYALLPLLVLGSRGKLAALASGGVTSYNPAGGWVQPSHGTLHSCPKSCGNVSIGYAFGIGSMCSRGADFNLTCNETAHSPRLYLRDGITQVISFEESFSGSNSIAASFSHTIPMQPGGNTSFHLKLVNNHSKSNIDALSNHTSKLWDRINIASDGPSGLLLWWQIVDQSNCVAAKKNKADYACISEHAECFNGSHGYNCMCSIGYTGNPYFPDGCSKLDVDFTRGLPELQ